MATDPGCGMTVERDGAVSVERDGDTYGALLSFVLDPDDPGIECVPTVLPMAVGATDLQTSMWSGHAAENTGV
jgi:hypothetical protein